MSGNGQYILSILGVGNRYELLYKKEGFKDVKAQHFQKALRQWYPDARMLVLATEEAEATYRHAVKEILDGKGEKGEILEIPDGRNIEEFYEIYSTIAQKIPSGARVIFDITHGYRSLPVLALLTLSYLREAKEVEVTEILYAAKQGRMGIVVDLAPFLSMFDWAQATQRYIDIGDARHLAKVMRATAGLGAFGGMDADIINDLAEGLENLSHALLSNNPFAAGRQAKALLSTLEEAERALGQQESGEAEHPIRLLLDRLQEQLKRMAFDHKSDDDATVLAALFNIMAWYYKHHYTEKAAALAKEFSFLLAKLQQGLPFNAEKDNNGEKYGADSLPSQLRDVFDQVKDLRNEAMHMNLDEITKDKEGRSYEEFRQTVGRALQELEKQARTAGLKSLASFELHG